MLLPCACLGSAGDNAAGAGAANVLQIHKFQQVLQSCCCLPHYAWQTQKLCLCQGMSPCCSADLLQKCCCKPQSAWRAGSIGCAKGCVLLAVLGLCTRIFVLPKQVAACQELKHEASKAPHVSRSAANLVSACICKAAQHLWWGVWHGAIQLFTLCKDIATCLRCLLILPSKPACSTFRMQAFC